jgi:DNA topoisomerase I
VAKLLGNTKAVCRKCYVHPAIVESYLEGKLGERLRGASEERTIVALLEAHMKPEHASRERHLTRLLARSLRTARRSHRNGQRAALPRTPSARAREA